MIVTRFTENFVICVKSPKISALGTNVQARLLQEALVFLSSSRYLNFVFFVRVDTVLTRTWFHFARDSIGSSREVLAVSRYTGAGLLRGSLGLLSSTKLSLKSWNRSGKSCNRSLCTSSRPSLLFLFSVSVGLFCRFPRSSSLVLPLLSDTCFSVYLPFRLIWNPVMKMMM